MSPDTQTYNHLLAGLAKSGQLGRAAQVFEDMRAEGLRPDSFTATVMLEVGGGESWDIGRGGRLGGRGEEREGDSRV